MIVTHHNCSRQQNETTPPSVHEVPRRNGTQNVNDSVDSSHEDGITTNPSSLWMVFVVSTETRILCDLYLPSNTLAFGRLARCSDYAIKRILTCVVRYDINTILTKYQGVNYLFSNFWTWNPLTSCANAWEDIAKSTRRLYRFHITAYVRPSPLSRCGLVNKTKVHFKNNLPTSNMTRSLISVYSALARTSSGSPPWRSTKTLIPSSSWSVSMSHLRIISSSVWLNDDRKITWGSQA